ncbi:MAG: hypothetical protein AAF654_08015 [Myxococcota bacterium]
MATNSSALEMPPAREFGWMLKPVSSSHFQIHERDNGQFCVVLNHALLRGVRSEMILWWFKNFANLRVLLVDTPGYEGTRVPAYLLWHPTDHYGVALSGRLGPGGTAQPGALIHIQEAMQYDVYGWKYPVDTKLKIFYVGEDGWAMGKSLPLVGPVMMLRIHFRDVIEGGECLGVHYHYEVVIGARGQNPVARALNRKLSSDFGPEFFAAWHRHNVIEVGVFENFLPALFEQRHNVGAIEYRLSMNPELPDPSEQTGQSLELFQERLNGFESSRDPHAYQAYDRTSFL